MMDQFEVCALFDFMEAMMLKFKRQGLFMADDLPLPLLIKAFDFLVVNGNHIALAKFLQFWYNHFPRLYESESEIILSYLILQHFAFLFFHWAAPIRQGFHHLLIFRALHGEKHGKRPTNWRKMVHHSNAKLNYVSQFFAEYKRRKYKWDNDDRITRRATNPDKIAMQVAHKFSPAQSFKWVNFFDGEVIDEFDQLPDLQVQKARANVPEAPAGRLPRTDSAVLSSHGPYQSIGAFHSRPELMDYKIDGTIAPLGVQDSLKNYQLSFIDFNGTLKLYLNIINSSGGMVEAQFPFLKMKMPVDKSET